jgi:hypothetical protein
MLQCPPQNVYTERNMAFSIASAYPPGEARNAAEGERQRELFQVEVQFGTPVRED